MTRLRFVPVVVALAMVCLAANHGFTEPSDAPTIVAQADAAKTAKAADEAKKPRGRLPNNYGKVGLSTQQRDKIYSIQAQYGSQIEALQKQIDDLTAKRDQEVHNVLTADQKQKLGQLIDESKKVQEQKKAKPADEAKAAEAGT